MRLRSSTAPIAAPEGPAQGKAATDGVRIGVPVAEVEDVSEWADVVAILFLANAHGFYLGL